MAMKHYAKPLVGKNPSIIINHYIYSWNITTTRDTIINNDGYTKATVKALSDFNASKIAANINGTAIPQISAGSEIEIEINGDVLLTASYSGTITMHLQITLHD